MSGIGKIPAKLPGDLQRTLEQIKERIEVLSGDRGSDGERAVLLNELVALGVLSRKGGAVVYEAPSIVDGGSSGSDLSVPPQPNSLSASGLFGAILLDWNFPAYINHDRTEIWRSETDLIGTATLIGTSQSKVYIDYVGDNDVYYYWIRLVSRAGVVGPYNGTAGTMGQTALDPSYVIQLLGDHYATQSLLDQLGQQIRGTYTGADLSEVTSGLLYQESMSRQTLGENLSQQISLLSAGVAGSFDTKKIWYFDTTTEGWSAYSNATVSWSGGSIVVDGTGAAPSIYLTSDMDPAVDGAGYQLVRARVKRTAGSGWSGKLQWRTSGHDFSASYEATATDPGLSVGDTLNVEWDMSGNADWKSSGITNLKIELGVDASDDFEIEWIGVGRNAPGASVAALYEEKTARITADGAEASKRELIATKTFGVADPSAINDISDVSSGLLYQERTARTTEDSALSQSIDLVESTANSKIKTYRQAADPQTTEPQTIGNVWYKTDDNNRPRTWNGSSWDLVDDQRIVSNYNTLNGRITSEVNAIVDPTTGVIAERIDTARAEWEGYADTAAQQELSSAIAPDGSIGSKYTVKLQTNLANGTQYIAGFGLLSYGNQSGMESSFVVSADRFAVTYPGANVASFPFAMGLVNGTYTVGISGNLVVDGSIYGGKIAANQINANHISAYQINAIHLNSDQIETRHLKSTQIEGRHIKAWTFTVAYGGATIDMANARITMSASGWNRITGVNFGASGNLVDYFGNGTASTANELNARFLFKNNGDAFFAGRIRGEFETKAWCRFDGISNQTAWGALPILDRFNIASITRYSNVAGKYTVTFAEPLANANYCVVCMATRDAADDGNPLVAAATALTTTGFTFRVRGVGSDAYRDAEVCTFVIFGSNVPGGTNVSSPTGGAGGGTIGLGNLPGTVIP